ncbi:MAG: radical SAM protein, partial [Candidatus Thermoplasmatota archaeon]|nr:radical SAM protein [Candidatus Thermoplasmatota archaeon]
MIEEVNRIIFGPVPSRRLGQSVGINNIPPKICTYSCVYCQIGRTYDQKVEREEFYKPNEIKNAVEKKITNARKLGEKIDYLTFVSDGEPTLDINIGKEIKLLKSLDFRIAVITNSSLLWRKDVQEDIFHADCVSLKIDTVHQESWKKINRPHQSLNMGKILSGLTKFSQDFHGDLLTETMLIKGINDNVQNLERIAEFIDRLDPRESYISIPTRPPAEKWVRPASEPDINMSYHIFKDRGIDVKYLVGYEGNDFAYTGNIQQDLLSIASVHPIREDGVNHFLSKSKADWHIVEKLIREGLLVEVKYKGYKYYLSKI